ncbi:hypothetical protein B0H14DRAFT_3522964 [Mycena olivaceomarginata]|nr:hypothetical protein B0H14DRAFT_3522964 [Mycena olivaceomarginata]
MLGVGRPLAVPACALLGISATPETLYGPSMQWAPDPANAHPLISSACLTPALPQACLCAHARLHTALICRPLTEATLDEAVVGVLMPSCACGAGRWLGLCD